jgi:hypothetical protein
VYRYTIHDCRRRFLPGWALEFPSVSAESEGFDSPPRHQGNQDVGSLRFVALTAAAGRLSMKCPCSRTVPSDELSVASRLTRLSRGVPITDAAPKAGGS